MANPNHYQPDAAPSFPTGEYAVSLAHYPEGQVNLSDFQFVPQPSLAEVTAALQDGEIAVRPAFLSVDPYMRGRMRNQKGYFTGPFVPGQPCEGGAVLEVVASKSPSHAVGSHVCTMGKWSSLSVINTATAGQIYTVAAQPGVPLSAYIGAVGMPGLTAYFGLIDVCAPQPGEVVVVSGAAGAVGQLVCQIAKIKGCFVIGIAGSASKLEFLKTRCKCDVALDYKQLTTFQTMKDAIAAAAPKGVNIYFDNVGGYISDAVTTNMAAMGRISVCGQISMYDTPSLQDPPQGPRFDFMLVTKQLKKQGWLVFQWASRFPEGMAALTEWIQSGQLVFDETFANGLHSIGKAFVDMMAGHNLGKMVVRC